MNSRLIGGSVAGGIASALTGLLIASAVDAPAVVSRVTSADGRIISFYPISTPTQTVEGPYWTYSTDCIIAFPENYTETGDVVDTFELPTEEGVPVIIEHKWHWGKPSRLNVKGPTEGRTLPKGDRSVSYTLKTTSGPPVLITMRLHDGRIADRRFQIAEPAASSEQDRPRPISAKSLLTAEEFAEAIAASQSASVSLALERRLFLSNRAAASNFLNRLSDPNPKLRESAAALARWFPGSVAPSALAERMRDSDPRVAREARYSLNVLLLREGKEPDAADARELIPQMLQLFIQELCRNPNYDWAAGNFEPRRSFLLAEQIAVLEHNIPTMTQVEVDTTALEVNSIQSFRPRARIRFAFLSDDQFRDRVKEAWVPAVHFHMMRTRDNYARVALSGMAERDQHWEMNWVALFQKTGDRWRPLAAPPYNEKYRLGRNYSNMNPLAVRDFDGLSPFDLERFMFGIERIRTIDVRKARLVERDNFDFRWAEKTTVLDSKYEPCLRQYLTDTNQAVSAAVRLSLGRMGREDVIPDIVSLYADTPNQDVRRRAARVIQSLLVPQIERKGKPPSPLVLDDLLAATDSYLARADMRNNQGVRMAKAKATVLDLYALVELTWEDSGATFLCQRRQNKWQALGCLSGWIE